MTAESTTPASRISVTLNINMSVVIRKIVKEAVPPSLSSFEGHFAAQRQMPNTLPECAAHPLSQRAGSAGARREGERDRKREQREITERMGKKKKKKKKCSSQSRPRTGFCHCRSKSPQSHRSLPLKFTCSTLRNCLPDSKSLSAQSTHTDTETESAHTFTHKRQYSFRSTPTTLKHLYGLSRSLQNRTQPSSVRRCDASSVYK